MSDDPQESLDLFDEHEEIVSEDGKKVKRKGIFLLPNLLTTAALFAGFFSIISAINENFIYAGMAIFAAQMLDGLDGRVARLTISQSLFGAQYDSLSDVISFGLAPAIIVFLWGLGSSGQAGWVFSFVFVAAAAVRLEPRGVRRPRRDGAAAAGDPLRRGRHAAAEDALLGRRALGLVAAEEGGGGEGAREAGADADGGVSAGEWECPLCSALLEGRRQLGGLLRRSARRHRREHRGGGSDFGRRRGRHRG